MKMQGWLIAALLVLNAVLAYGLISTQTRSSNPELASALQSATAQLNDHQSRISRIENRIGSLAQVLPSDKTAKPIEFSKTFSFWVPAFSDPTRRVTDPAIAEMKFHEWLAGKFGGWSRWKVQGGEAGGTPEDGWFYQVSVPKGQAEISSLQMKNDILRHFKQESIYIVEHRHR